MLQMTPLSPPPPRSSRERPMASPPILSPVTRRLLLATRDTGAQVRREHQTEGGRRCCGRSVGVPFLRGKIGGFKLVTFAYAACTLYNNSWCRKVAFFANIYAHFWCCWAATEQPFLHSVTLLSPDFHHTSPGTLLRWASRC